MRNVIIKIPHVFLLMLILYEFNDYQLCIEEVL